MTCSCALPLCRVALTSCETIDPPTVDSSPPTVHVDLHAPRSLGWPEETVVPVTNPRRRAIGKNDPLTFVALAKDAVSGIANAEIVTVAFRQCTMSPKLSRVPRSSGGPAVGRTLLNDKEHVLGAASAGRGKLPGTRLLNANMTSPKTICLRLQAHPRKFFGF